MTTQKNNNRNLLLSFFIVMVAAIRVALNASGQLHALTSFSPIGAMALFGGAYFSKYTPALVVPLLTLFISDEILALTVYGSYGDGILYEGWYWVYGAFVLMVIAGKIMVRTIRVKNVLVAAFTIVFIHWMVSDAGVWLNSSVYPKTPAGWWACLAAALPFERNFLLGTLFYSALIFGGFEWVKKYTLTIRPA